MRAGSLLLASVLLGCAPVDRAEVDPGAGAPAGLGATLNVQVVADSVLFVLNVTNAGRAAVALEYASAQRYDFEVTHAGGEVVWRWSEERMFAQVMGQEVLLPGESLRYDAGWQAPADADYIVTGRLTSTNNPIELRTAFRPGG